MDRSCYTHAMVDRTSRSGPAASHLGRASRAAGAAWILLGVALPLGCKRDVQRSTSTNPFASAAVASAAPQSTSPLASAVASATPQSTAMASSARAAPIKLATNTHFVDFKTFGADLYFEAGPLYPAIYRVALSGGEPQMLY